MSSSSLQQYTNMKLQRYDQKFSQCLYKIGNVEMSCRMVLHDRNQEYLKGDQKIKQSKFAEHRREVDTFRYRE